MLPIAINRLLLQKTLRASARTVVRVALLGALALPTAMADRIQTVDGRVIEGKIIERKADEAKGELITVQIGQARIVLPSSAIKLIVEATPAENEALNARNHFKAGQPVKALDALVRSHKAAGASDGIATLIAMFGEELTEAFDQLDDSQRRGLTALLESVETANQPYRDDYMGYRLRLFAMLDNRPQVEALFELLGPDYFDEHPHVRDKLAQWLLDKIGKHLKASKFDQGLTLLKDLERVDDQRAAARRIQFFLQWARHEREQEKYDQALQIYVQYMIDTAPNIARDRIVATLAEAEQEYRKHDQIPRAAQLYEQYGIPQVPEIARERIVALWIAQGRIRMNEGDLKGARDAFLIARRTNPESAQQDLLELEYRKRMADIPEDDLLLHYQLGVWCLENDLLDHALLEFNTAKESKLVRNPSATYIQQIYNKKAERKLERLLDLYDEGQLVKVLTEVHLFLQEGHPEGYVNQAIELEGVTRDALRLRQAERPQQATTLLEHAERSFYTEQYEQADQLLDVILEKYSDTLANAKARNLKALVRDKLMLGQLESGDAARSQDTVTTETLATGKEIDRLLRALANDEKTP